MCRWVPFFNACLCMIFSCECLGKSSKNIHSILKFIIVQSCFSAANSWIKWAKLEDGNQPVQQLFLKLAEVDYLWIRTYRDYMKQVYNSSSLQAKLSKRECIIYILLIWTDILRHNIKLKLTVFPSFYIGCKGKV